MQCHFKHFVAKSHLCAYKQTYSHYNNFFFFVYCRYELSQDLLEKQIELLERKYGGVRARNAAVTIQRAFRHYMMVKKFASITAMAKAEKRLSRRVLIVSGGACGAGAVVGGVEDGPASNSSLSSAYGSATESQLDMMHQQQQQQLQAPGTTSPYANQQSQTQQQQQQPRVTILAGPPGSVVGATSVPIVSSSAMSARTPPTRSLSMRERRQQDGSPIPRSQSGELFSSDSCFPGVEFITYYVLNFYFKFLVLNIFNVDSF